MHVVYHIVFSLSSKVSNTNRDITFKLSLYQQNREVRPVTSWLRLRQWRGQEATWSW
ncbi:hypothetical protein Hanom_Chr03g00212391 [Helianthus anomalus]